MLRLELPGLPRSALSLSGRRFNGDLVVDETSPTFGSFATTWAWKAFFGRFLLRLSRIKRSQCLAPEHSILVRIFSINCLVRLNYAAVEVEQVFMYDL